MSKCFFTDEDFDKADHVGEIRRKTEGCPGFQGLPIYVCGACDSIDKTVIGLPQKEPLVLTCALHGHAFGLRSGVCVFCGVKK